MELLKKLMLVSDNLHQHLMGLSKDCETFSGTNVYGWALGLWFVTMFLPASYYLGMDNFRHTNIGKWVIIGLILTVIFNPLILYFGITPVSQSCEELNLTNREIIFFLLADWLVAVFIFFASSLGWKRVSKNHKNIPF